MAYTWSERATIDTLAADNEAVANLLCTDSRTDLVVGTDNNIVIVPVPSLDGGFGDPVTVVEGDTYPSGLSLGRSYYVLTVGDGTVRFRAVEQGGTYAVVGNAVDVHAAFGTPKFPALAVHPTNWRMFAATWHGAKTILSTSPDRGAEWHDGHDLPGTVWVADVDDLQYPSLYCDKDYLWMVGWLDGAYQGAAGKVMLYRYAANASLTAVGSPVTVGPSDEGRPGILRRPATGEVYVVAPKTGTTWTDLPGSDRGIVEYRSVDSGGSFTRLAFHEVTV